MKRCFTSRMLVLLAVLCGVRSVSAFPQSEPVGLRQIVLESEAEAVGIRQSALDGAGEFEVLARERSLDGPSAATGGYLGRILLSDLRLEFQEALVGIGPGGISAPIRLADQYYLFQIVPESEAEWIDLDDAGARALTLGQDSQAVEYFEAAVEMVEERALGDARLARSIESLANVYRILDRASEAEALYRRSLVLLEALGASDLEKAQVLSGLGMVLTAQAKYGEAEQAYRQTRTVREEALGPDAPEVAATLHNLAELYAAEDRHVEAASLYEQSLTLLERSLGAGHPATLASASSLTSFRLALMPELLERFSTIVGLSEFQDQNFEQAIAEVRELLPLAPLSELSYVQIKDVLLEVGLSEQTEDVLRTGLEQFPDSRILRIYLADLLAGTGRTANAIGVLEEASRLSRPEGLDQATDRQQRGMIYQRIGDIQTALNEFDEALAAYERSLEIDPASPGGRVKLGKAYFSSNRVEEALAQYERAVVERPEDNQAYLALTEGHLASGQWARAAAAAERAIDLGTSDSRALYLLGTSLVRMGQRDEGQGHLREFARIDAAFREVEHENREVDAISIAAIGALRQGDADAAMETLRDGIELFPNAGRLHMNLGMVQNRLGQHQMAVGTFEAMLELEIGRRFLIHKNLAEEYLTLGDLEASTRHRDIYLDTREAELIVYAPE